MNQKTIAIVVIAVIIVAVIGVAAYYFLSSGGTGEPEPTPTPTPGIEEATSLQFKVEITGGEAAGTYEYMAKNIGTDDMMIRVEIPIEGMDDLVYIVNGAQQKAWANEGTGWVDLSDAFSDQWDAWKATWDGYTDNLATWTSGDWTYTDPADGSTVRIYDITVNASLEDSLFEVTA
jgi:hypothetical protein